MYSTISQIQRRHEGHWFSADTMRFFGSKIESGVINGRYFVSSEDNFDRTARFYSVRVADDEGEIGTWGEFQAYETLAEARAAAEAAPA
jgi:hypothetical protein